MFRQQRLNEVLGDSLFLQINALIGGCHKEQPQLEVGKLLNRPPFLIYPQSKYISLNKLPQFFQKVRQPHRL